MKNKLATVLAVIVCIVLLTPTVFAANQVPEMEIDVALLSDGSAQITQIWTTDTDEGTEFVKEADKSLTPDLITIHRNGDKCDFIIFDANIVL